jgi:hypothetical protein
MNSDCCELCPTCKEPLHSRSLTTVWYPGNTTLARMGATLAPMGATLAPMGVNATACMGVNAAACMANPYLISTIVACTRAPTGFK